MCLLLSLSIVEYVWYSRNPHDVPWLWLLRLDIQTPLFSEKLLVLGDLNGRKLVGFALRGTVLNAEI